jgi:AraC-like DNA-binding protein
MLTAPRVRKLVLTALQEHILPALEAGAVTQLLVDATFDFSSIEHWALREEPLPNGALIPPQVIWPWYEERPMTAIRMPFLGFVYEGTADLPVGFTAEMAEQRDRLGMPAAPGIANLRLRAPASIALAPAMPRQTGSYPMCDQSRAGFGASRSIWFYLFPDELLVYCWDAGPEGNSTTHPLEIKDSTIVQTAHLYLTALPLLASEGPGTCLGILTTLMKRLTDYLIQYGPALGNTSWPFLFREMREGADERSKEIYLRVSEYIDLHLPSDLGWERLGQEFNLTPFHINRVFKDVTGRTLSEYVFTARIVAARQMLEFTTERVGDIASMTGFAGLKSFSGSFQRHLGCSPTAYRKRYQNGE